MAKEDERPRPTIVLFLLFFQVRCEVGLDSCLLVLLYLALVLALLSPPIVSSPVNLSLLACSHLARSHLARSHPQIL